MRRRFRNCVSRLTRGGTNCTANDGSIGAVTLNGGSNLPARVNPSSCTLGSTITVDLLVNLGAISATNRFNVGFTLRRTASRWSVAPPTGAETCSVGYDAGAGGDYRRSTPRSRRRSSGTWSNLDGNACGDLDKRLRPGHPGEPGLIAPTSPIQVQCVAGAGGNLNVSVGLSYRQSSAAPATPGNRRATRHVVQVQHDVVHDTDRCRSADGDGHRRQDLVGFNDPGLFNLLVNGIAVASDVGDGGRALRGISTPAPR